MHYSLLPLGCCLLAGQKNVGRRRPDLVDQKGSAVGIEMVVARLHEFGQSVAVLFVEDLVHVKQFQTIVIVIVICSIILWLLWLWLLLQQLRHGLQLALVFPIDVGIGRDGMKVDGKEGLPNDLLDDRFCGCGCCW